MVMKLLVITKKKLPTYFSKSQSQASVLSPSLLLINLYTVLRATNTSPREIQWGLNIRLEDFIYTDDLCFLSHAYQEI